MMFVRFDLVCIFPMRIVLFMFVFKTTALSARGEISLIP